MTLQLDLFGEVEADELAATAAIHQRRRDALICLRDAHPAALEILTGDRRPDTGEIKVGLTRPWAYSVRKDGFHFEDHRTWGGWYTKPAHHVTWAELDELLGADPRVDELRAWSASLTAIDAWRERRRPFELYPDPHGWHPSYIEGDHARSGWEQRRQAWATVRALLDDAIERIGGAR